MSIVNTLAIALALRPRRRWDTRDGAAALVVAAAIPIVLIAPPAAPAVGIVSALLIALGLQHL